MMKSQLTNTPLHLIICFADDLGGQKTQKPNKINEKFLRPHLLRKVFPVAIGLTLPLVSKHLQFILIEQLIGDFQNSTV